MKQNYKGDILYLYSEMTFKLRPENEQVRQVMNKSHEHTSNNRSVLGR